jgi:hypothetical protein
MKKILLFLCRTIIGLWKTKSSAIEQRAKLEEDEEDESYEDLDDVQSVLSIGDVNLSKEYTVEHPIDVSSLCSALFTFFLFFLLIGLGMLLLLLTLIFC